MANVLNNLFGGGKATPDPVAAQAGDSGTLLMPQMTSQSLHTREMGNLGIEAPKSTLAPFPMLEAATSITSYLIEPLRYARASNHHQT